MAPTIFGRFSLFLIPTYSENLIHLAPMAPKLKILEDLFEGDSPKAASQFQADTSPF